MSVAAAAPLLNLSGLTKTFGGACALSDVDLRIERGEVHGLLGQNGSGKSTLLKILAGFHAPDAGQLEIRGQKVGLPLPSGAFRELGLAFVHQDLALAPDLSVTENMIVGRLASHNSRRLKWSSEHARVADTLARYKVTGIQPRTPVARLSQMQRALIAIVRAVEDLRQDSEASVLLILDEPTAFLPRAGVKQLFGLMREIVADGRSVLFVTHDLDEVWEVCDRATVLRDGRRAGCVTVADATAPELVEMIVGYRMDRHLPVRPASRVGAACLRARDVTGVILEGVNLDVNAGEVVGLTGLLGSGFEELAHVLFGARPGSGTVEVNGRSVGLADLTPQVAMRIGMGFVPADRSGEAVINALSVTDNITMTTLPRYRKAFKLSRERMHEGATDLGEQFMVTPNEPRRPFASLSGGNQQKAVLAKWVQGSPAVLLLDQPTQGVDVGARRQIYRAIQDAAARGTAVVCASADYEELEALCDRVVIIARGHVALQLADDDIVKEEIAKRVFTSAPSEGMPSLER